MIEPEASSALPSPEQQEPRDLYLARRNHVESHFLNHPPRQDKKEHKDGASVRVYSVCCVLPETLRKPAESKVRISVYVPGLFDNSTPNYGNHPLENKLAGALLTGDTDAVVMLKSEGLNGRAYETADGKGRKQALVAKDAVDVLAGHIEQIKQQLHLSSDAAVELELIGYSEGSTQAASIAWEIHSRNLGKIAAVTAIAPSGLVGPEEQESVNVVRSLRKSAALRYTPPSEGTIHNAGDSYEIDSKLMGDADQGGLETALGRARVSLPADVHNVAKWAVRYARSLLGVAQEVPSERLQAALSHNADFDRLAAAGIPLVVFSCTGDVFFPAAEVRASVDKISQAGGRVLEVTTNAGHDFPHANPSGVAYMLQLLRSQRGI